MATLIDNSRPGITVTNTTTETDVYSVTIPGGTLGTSGMLYIVLLGRKLKNGGGADSEMRMRVYYGATLLAALPPFQTQDDNASLRTCRLEAYLFADGATNAQRSHALLAANRNVANADSPLVALPGTATEDSTVDKLFRVTWQQAATTLHSYTSEAGIVLVT